MSTDDPSEIRATWFKSSYSGPGATECVEAAMAPGEVHIRDSVRPAGARITFGGGAWDGFLQVLRDGAGDGRPV